MNQKQIRLVLASVLFVAWMGYFAYLVHALPKSPNELPIVLSRPQILVSEVDIIGTIIDVKEGTVKVQEVLYARGEDKPEAGDTIKIGNLEEVKPPLADQANLGPLLLPLQTLDAGKSYRVVRVPPSPGYNRNDPRVYPDTDETRAEYRPIKEAKEKEKKE